MMRDVKLHATLMSADVPLVPTLTFCSRSDEPRITKCSRFDSMSRFSSAFPGQLSLKFLTQVEGETEELAKSPRKPSARSASSFGESCSLMTGLVPLTMFCCDPPDAFAGP